MGKSNVKMVIKCSGTDICGLLCHSGVLLEIIWPEKLKPCKGIVDNYKFI